MRSRLKDGQKLEPSSRVALTQEPDGTVLLSIEHATPADAGKYVCVAKNPEGKAESASAVKVTGKDCRHAFPACKVAHVSCSLLYWKSWRFFSSLFCEKQLS